ncbi:HAD family hydrolase [Streptacidiphilus pinicola]|uniref:HAD family hydrolase n=1 Tax=Streptacidiphilus pinicola TaxID=2219663 RepID=A0A2X0I7T4_9ACTN|nr:HAD family hydrolase [Streptacidiphilus pinicola]RAG80974.1 HAD family hydrolase [Streptacidiphilus pinicola]
MPPISAVVFDVGETITSDRRFWADWADWLEVPHHTLSALVGAVVAQGRDNADALRLIKPDLDLWAEYEKREKWGRGEYLDESDLYPDVRTGLQALRDAGLKVYVAGNQTARVAGLLRTLELPVDGIGTSGEWGAAKPHRGFFDCVLKWTGLPAEQILYVGDHPANDIAPAQAAGLKVCHIRRGPWGYLWADQPEAAAADYRINNIQELPALLA